MTADRRIRIHVAPETAQRPGGAAAGAIVDTPVQIWNRWAPDALLSPLAPADLVAAYNRWQPDHLKIRNSHAA